VRSNTDRASIVYRTTRLSRNMPTTLLYQQVSGKAVRGTRYLRWEGFMEKVGFEPGVKERRSDW